MKYTNQKGATLTEYAVILAVFLIGVVFVLGLLGSHAESAFNSVAAELLSVTTS